MNLQNLELMLNDHQTGMSDFQDDYLVTARAGGTTYGQYKQALRELYRRLRGLRELIYGENGRKLSEIEIRELEDNLRGPELSQFDRERLEIKLKHRYLISEESDRAIKNTYREFIRFFQHAEFLKEKVGDLSPSKRRELELEMWMYRMKEMAAIDFMQGGRLSKTTIEFISVLPREAREKAYAVVLNPKSHQELIDNYLRREDIYEIPFEEIEIHDMDVNSIESAIVNLLE